MKMDAIEKNLMRLPRKPVAPDLASRILQGIREERKLVSFPAISAMNRIQSGQWAIEQKPHPIPKMQPLLQTQFDLPMPRQVSRLPRRVASGTVQNILWATREQHTTMHERRSQ
jgi:hypothetical protein